MEKVNWKLDKKNTADYLDLCQRAVEDDTVFANFRRVSPMNMIVENSPEKSGGEYLEVIDFKFGWLMPYMDKFKTSDTIGNPETFANCYGRISPTTLRYIKTLGDLQRFFGPLDGMRIAEIGGGYGGLCKIIHDVYKPKEYIIYDLPEVKALQSKFLNFFGFMNVNLFHRHDKVAPFIDLLIAMYSWSELSHDLQKEYLANVIRKAKNCYIMLNYDMKYSYRLLKDAFPNAEITDHNLFYDNNNTEYAPYNRFVIIKN
jgi:hypothetical protein